MSIAKYAFLRRPKRVLYKLNIKAFSGPFVPQTEVSVPFMQVGNFNALASKCFEAG